MEIRRATGGDVEAIRRVAQRSWERDYPAFLTRETITAGIEEWYGQESIRADLGNPRTHILVADADGAVVGFVQAHRSDSVGNVLRLYVDPDHRREGIATQLFDAAASALRSDGAALIRAMALTANEPGCAFYESLGMADVGTDSTTIDGDRYDESVFELSEQE